MTTEYPATQNSEGISMSNEIGGESRQEEEELLSLKRQVEVMEARGKLAEARKRLAETEDSIGKLRQPWWRSGKSVTILAGIIGAIVPLTAQIQSWKEQAMKEKELNFQIREKYLTAVLRDPRQEERVLQFIFSTADDNKVKLWADTELKAAKNNVAKLDNIAAQRKKLYFEAVGVVASLADSNTSETEWKAKQMRFWELYKHDLLPVESPAVEGLMVRIGRELNKCQPGRCQILEGLAYELARQMKAEISADTSVVMPPEKPSIPSNESALQEPP
jgi:hypothetical protein